MQYESRDVSGGCRMDFLGIISLTGVSNPAKVTISISSDFDHTCYKMLTTHSRPIMILFLFQLKQPLSIHNYSGEGKCPILQIFF